MIEFKLQPGDILVNVNYKNDPWSRIRRWAVGPHSHVFLYMGKLRLIVHRKQGRILRFPMLFESNARGVVLQSLSNRYGQEVIVMRLRQKYQKRIPHTLTEAVKLASDPQAYYDYLCVIRFILPRVICEKLHLPIPLSWHRDPKQICSEAVYEVCYRGGLKKILPTGIVPLPGDFVTDSPLLEEVGCVILSQEVVYSESGYSSYGQYLHSVQGDIRGIGD